MMRRLVSAVFAAVLLACEGSTDPINLTGTWTGTITITIGGTASPIPLTLVVTQTGNSVSGTLQAFDDADLAVLSGSVGGTTVTITGTPEPRAGSDCHLFSFELVFTASGSTLTAAGAGGVSCGGNGAGGHEPLENLTAATGTLTRS